MAWWKGLAGIHFVVEMLIMLSAIAAWYDNSWLVCLISAGPQY